MKNKRQQSLLLALWLAQPVQEWIPTEMVFAMTDSLDVSSPHSRNGSVTLQEALMSDRTSTALLDGIRQVAKRRGIDCPLGEVKYVLAMIYFLAIVHARLSLGIRISSDNDGNLIARACLFLDQTWIPPIYLSTIRRFVATLACDETSSQSL